MLMLLFRGGRCSNTDIQQVSFIHSIQKGLMMYRAYIDTLVATHEFDWKNAMVYLRQFLSNNDIKRNLEVETNLKCDSISIIGHILAKSDNSKVRFLFSAASSSRVVML